MIVTLTPNPSLDRTLELVELERGQVVRATGVRVDPGGKGINVAIALQGNGHAARAVIPLGGREGEQLRDLLLERGLDVTAVPIAASVRTNISLVEPDGTVTKVNAPGPILTTTETEALTTATIDALEGASWVAGCGSLPPGAPEDLFASLVSRARRRGIRVAIDTSGAPLAAAITAAPDLIKPNSEELAAIVDRELRTLGDVVGAAEGLRTLGIATVVVSLGADGAVLIDGAGAWHATTPPIVARSAVGAGDSLVAGLLSADAHGPEALRMGVAYGVAAAQLPGTQLPGPDDLDTELVEVHPIDPARPLTDHGGNR